VVGREEVSFVSAHRDRFAFRITVVW